MSAPWLLACASVGAAASALPDDEATETRRCLAHLSAWAKGDGSVRLDHVRRWLWIQRNWLLQDMFAIRQDPKAPRGSYAHAYRLYLVAHVAFGLAQAAMEPEYEAAAIVDALAIYVQVTP